MSRKPSFWTPEVISFFVKLYEEKGRFDSHRVLAERLRDHVGLYVSHKAVAVKLFELRQEGKIEG